MNRLIYFILHIHVFAKFAYTNRRFKKKGYRKFKINIFEALPAKKGGGFAPLHIVTIKCGSLTKDGKHYPPEKNMFFELRDKYNSYFVKGDHLTYKEII